MSVKKKHEAKFTFRSFIRLIIFTVILFFLINLISSNKNSSLSLDKSTEESILGKTTEISDDLYNSLPESSQSQIENWEDNQAVVFIQEKIELIKQQSQGFPQTQIKELQKMILKNFYENALKNIEEN